MSNSIISYEEQDYITNLISINKNLRDQLESIYKLLSKKVIIDNNSNRSNNKDDNANYNKLIQIINDLEVLRFNLGIQMRNQSDIITSFKQIQCDKSKYDQIIQEHNSTITSLHSQIEEISKENIISSNRIVTLQKGNETLMSQLAEMTNAQKKIIESNSQLAKENAKLKEDKVQLSTEITSNEIMIEEMNSKIDVLSHSMIEMEEKYKKKIQQKNMIISTIDNKLQEYEKAKGGKGNDENEEENELEHDQGDNDDDEPID